MAPNTTPDGRARNRSVEILLGRRARPRPASGRAVSADDPAALSLFRVGTARVRRGHRHGGGAQRSLKGTVFYPATAAGNGTPFATALAGRAPLVVMAHGNHELFHDPGDRTTRGLRQPRRVPPDPEPPGLRLPAGACWPAWAWWPSPSDCGPTNCRGLSATNIRERAEMIVQAPRALRRPRQHGRRVQGPPRPPARGPAGPFARRGGGAGGGGDAGRAGRRGERDGEGRHFPARRQTWAVLPAGRAASRSWPCCPPRTGTWSTTTGAKFYDKAVRPIPSSASSTSTGRATTCSTASGSSTRAWVPPCSTRLEHERILSAYGCAFFRQVLLGQPMVKFLRVDELPPATRTDAVHVSFEQPGATTRRRSREPERRPQRAGTGRRRRRAASRRTSSTSRVAGARTFNSSFFGNTVGLVVTTTAAAGRFRSALGAARDLTGKELWLGRPRSTTAPACRPGRRVTGSGWRTAPDGWPSPTPTMRAGCPVPTTGAPSTRGRAVGPNEERSSRPSAFRPRASAPRAPSTCANVRAVVLQLDRGDRRAIALDQLQIV